MGGGDGGGVRGRLTTVMLDVRRWLAGGDFLPHVSG